MNAVELMRVLVIITGVIAGTFILLVCFSEKRSRAQTFRIMGGGLLCLTVSASMLAFMLDLDPVIRVPMLVLTLTWCGGGACAEYIQIRRKKRQ